LPNPGFEAQPDGIAGWTTYAANQSAVAAQAVVIRSGSAAAQVSANGTMGQSFGLSLSKNVLAATAPFYCARAWVNRGSSRSPLNLVLELQRDGGAPLTSALDAGLAPADDGWDRIDTGLATPFSGELGIRVETTWVAGALFYVDDAAVWEAQGDGGCGSGP
jgi:hypothetical protein